MDLKKIFGKNKFKITNPIGLIEWLLFALLVSGIVSLLLFWYSHFYQTITQAEIILVLAKEVSLQDVELEKFEKVLATHELKTKNMLPPKPENPFVN